MALTYLVTGASRGLGLEFVRQLAEKKHTVIACARAPDNSQELKKLVDNKHVYAVTLDTVDEASIKSAVAAVVKIVPDGIDVLINNAGVMGEDGDVLAAPAKEYMRVFETNVVGTASVSQVFLPLLRKRNTRRIINISSDDGSIANTHTGYSSAYHVSKAALNMLTKAWASHLQPEHFTIVAIHPGWIQTDMGTSMAPLTPREAIADVLNTVEQLGTKHSGLYMNNKGERMAW
ncbi:4-dihydrotrisporin dehydrogenase [Radiomyces spectabilis]|uniref:4-dihydrotrisporin dehydrogenase n=1 Tax=Radiomyces spectabilis TaxID=64574 RepID=UPI00221EE019|nr:4-dihydrotrisporin dehydrogenase [Radiomyces spectabilis]KAI8370638.1 4-dihydrotrisporin dehydrogenase [Radiomyces spectabilis]